MTERTVDLDAAAAARRTAKGEPIRVTFKGQVFELEPDPPFELAAGLADLLEVAEAHGGSIADLASSGAAEGAGDLGLKSVAAFARMTEAILGDQVEKFRALRPTMADMMRLIQSVVPLYSFESLGES